MATGCLLDFDKSNPRAQSFARTRSSALVTEITDETREALRLTVSRAIDEGIAPRRAARQIREMVGLHSRAAQAVAALEDELRTAKPGSLITRFEPRPGVRGRAGFRVRVPKGGLSDAEIDRLTKRYARMHRNLRARTIARTETLRAANEGVRELWMQARDIGDLADDQKRVLIATMDNRTRPAHAAANGQVRGLDEPFDMGDGTTEPGEAPGCRCAQGLATPEDLEGAA